MKKIILMSIILGLSGCNKNAQDSLKQEIDDKIDSVQFNEELEIDPEMQGLGIYEIGDLIRNLMIGKDQNLGWDFLANDPKILWQTVGVEEAYNSYLQQTQSQRVGWVRVHFLGDRSSILKERKYELPWNITFEGGYAKLGIEKISVMPGKTMNECFGGEYDGCVFDLEKSLKRSGLAYIQECEANFAGSMIQTYLVSAKNKHPMKLAYSVNAGSGGESAFVEIYTDPDFDLKTVCAQFG